MTARPLIAFFKDLDKHDLPLVGGKGANLGEMTKAKFPVPNGFAVTTESYDLFLQKNEIAKKINDILAPIDVNQPDQLQEVSEKVQKLVSTSLIPREVADDAVKAYKKLSGLFKTALVAVRSSATAEDLPGASFAGQQATYLNVKGENNLLAAIRDCWASLFTARAIFYRAQNKISTEKVKFILYQLSLTQRLTQLCFEIINPGYRSRILSVQN